MQFKRKLVNQASESDEKADFRSDFDLFGPNLGSKKIFRRFYL